MRYFATLSPENKELGYELNADGKIVEIPYEILLGNTVVLSTHNPNLGAQLAINVTASHRDARLYLNGDAQDPGRLPTSKSIIEFFAE
jgi:hypothetical protein